MTGKQTTIAPTSDGRPDILRYGHQIQPAHANDSELHLAALRAKLARLEAQLLVAPPGPDVDAFHAQLDEAAQQRFLLETDIRDLKTRIAVIERAERDILASLETLQRHYEEIRDICECAICCQPNVIPWIMANCGHSFCEICTLQIIKHCNDCPTCAVPIKQTPVQSFDYKKVAQALHWTKRGDQHLYSPYFDIAEYEA
ncbi:hypothetical protein AURDEDRAFT_172653 [Auricularia subglabra TFB-10046 SS5]|nr:hypothetical protein AURDEDRAFT_172653 [Auricularia subglabra TFB-10046 SS5]